MAAGGMMVTKCGHGRGLALPTAQSLAKYGRWPTASGNAKSSFWRMSKVRNQRGYQLVDRQTVFAKRVCAGRGLAPGAGTVSLCCGRWQHAGVLRATAICIATLGADDALTLKALA
ncbi:alkaline proteinase inhibitor [Serratia ureilytica]